MTELLLSSQRLEQQKVLHTGKLDLLEALQKHSNLEIVQLEGKLPAKSIILEWKEVQTPTTPASFSDLAGKKLTEYKFQYLGQFSFDGNVVEAENETFIADFPEQNISRTSLDSTGWLNCTWLLDFLMNAEAIEQDSLRNEGLIWRKNKKGFMLSLSRESTDARHAEQEKFVFENKFKAVNWSHNALFSGQEIC
ncbi:MAG: Unknown protein [uncultured Aureispira sp.]|uniref:Uncharacterized protein n=1 Tax=uncultured Aureispira sp. TaxID=1331704 RepID=A0A6S6THH5_9BACT|nr:MAG: Unknown protein [uncultured Aureispira sp.]